MNEKVGDRIEKIQVARSSMPPFAEYVEEIRDLWDSRWLTNHGVKHEELTRELCRYLDAPHTELYTNGHIALEIALRALHLSGEVITTPFTYASTSQAIVNAGLTPVFCDIRKDDYTIDTNLISPLVNERTCAILPVHVYGNICAVNEIDGIARRFRLKVVYDAAHAFGETFDGANISHYGDLSMFSLHATKVFHTVEGGALTYRDDDLTQELQRIKRFGLIDDEVIGYGTNAKMSEFHAAMGLCNLRHMDEYLELRRQAVQRYRERLSGVAGLYLCATQQGVTPNYAYMPVRFLPDVFRESRDDVAARLAAHGIYPRKYFYPPTSDNQYYPGLFNIHETPVAYMISSQILVLPLYADLTVQDVDRICDIILEGSR